ncbi:MAG: hypothetical protein UT28_C0001G0803 [Berkelbacteria bacterium GW2011_GWE1_39_12]|uniref:Uncharacterized protein n=1 Tax=Berkelbacteria bacterium GW2011_GWE1_39_12 TaxID=1618337 RepID=A0A0G4B586_9BACT|nr:MAG: hypothetical protein UT28_C0001G0803 [Berkelbacteria bacterium GW2011_GWE1_39_12]
MDNLEKRTEDDETQEALADDQSFPKMMPEPPDPDWIGEDIMPVPVFG